MELGRAALRREGSGERWLQYGCDGEVPMGEGDALRDGDAVPGEELHGQREHDGRRGGDYSDGPCLRVAYLGEGRDG